MSLTKPTITTYEYNSNTRELNIPFDYLKRDFINVTLRGKGKPVIKLEVLVDYRFTSKNSITIIRPYQSNTGYNYITIQRITDATKRIVNFQDGSILNSTELNVSQLQALHVSEEARDLASYSITVDNNGDLDARFRRIVNLGDPINPLDAVNKKYIDEAAEGVVKYRDQALQYRDEAREAAESAVAGGIPMVNLRQSTGQGNELVMSQKAVTDELAKVRGGVKGDGVSFKSFKTITRFNLPPDRMTTPQGLAITPTHFYTRYKASGASFGYDEKTIFLRARRTGLNNLEIDNNSYEYMSPIQSGHHGMGILTRKGEEFIIGGLNPKIRTTNEDGKGLTIFKFGGESYREIRLFGDSRSNHRYRDYYRSIVGVSQDNKKFILLAEKVGYTNITFVFIYDVEKVLEAEEPLNVYPDDILTIERPKTKGGEIASSVTMNEDFVYVSWGFYPAQSPNIIGAYDKKGNLARFIHKAGLRHTKSAYIEEGINEPEGLCLLDDGTLLLLETSADFNCESGESNFIQFKGRLFMPTQKSRDIPPTNSRYWLCVGFAESEDSHEKWSLSKDYNAPPKIKKGHKVVRVSYEDVVGEDTKDSCRALVKDEPVLAGGLAAPPAGIHLTYQYGDTFRLKPFSDELNKHIDTWGIATLTDSTRFYFNDNSPTSEQKAAFTITYNEAKDATYLRHNKEASNGAGINLYGNKVDPDKITFLIGGSERFSFSAKAGLLANYGTGEWSMLPNAELGALEFRCAKKIALGAGINMYDNTHGDKINFYTGGKATVVIESSGNLRPDALTQDLGTSSKPWNRIYSKDGTIQTSDARLKTHIRPIDARVLDAWEKVDLVSYKWIDSEERKGLGARTHIGILAQCIINAFEEEGLNAFDYGIVCYEKWDDKEPCYEEGYLITERVKGGDKYMVRMDQCLYLEAECNRRKLKQMEERLTLLEEKLNA